MPDPMTMMNVASTLFGMFGNKQKTPNLYNAFSQGAGKQLDFYDMFGQQFMDRWKDMNPTFGKMEDRVMGDLDDTGRTKRLEKGFMDKLFQQQSLRGMERSPSGALQSSFRGLMFGEQMRDKAQLNASNFMNNPMFAQLLGMATGPNLGIQQAGLRSQTRAANRATMLNQLSAGMNSQMQIQGMQNQQSFQNQLANMWGGGGGGGFAPQGSMSLNQMSQNMPWNQTNPFSSPYPAGGF